MLTVYLQKAYNTMTKSWDLSHEITRVNFFQGYFKFLCITLLSIFYIHWLDSMLNDFVNNNFLLELGSLEESPDKVSVILQGCPNFLFVLGKLLSILRTKNDSNLH